ncbi:uncharacterized protein IUM83_15790 [Phytophthora cinnamomi]|uniref:uncharacterized protein n=1 Tax=Phytophthora cinnamomi TaxID=4785 RepID=UPI00355A0E76|nr:hypothetical protein IUM83_15790 [Phytophthora cinnamomi]
MASAAVERRVLFLLAGRGETRARSTLILSGAERDPALRTHKSPGQAYGKHQQMITEGADNVRNRPAASHIERPVSRFTSSKFCNCKRVLQLIRVRTRTGT